MSKTKSKWIIIFPILSMVAMIVYLSVSALTTETSGTGVDGILVFFKNSWILLLFISFNLIAIILATIKKQRIIRIIAIVFSLVLIITFIASRKITKQFSFDNQQLIEIEEKIQFDFPKNCCIVTNNDGKFIDGAIYSKEENALKELIYASPIWLDSLPEEIENKLPKEEVGLKFVTVYLGACEKFTFIEENGKTLVMQYDVERNTVSFLIFG